MTAGMEGMAAQDPPHAQVAPPKGAMERQALGRVLRTGRIKPAHGTQEPRKRELVHPDQRDQHLSDGPGRPNSREVAHASRLAPTSGRGRLLGVSERSSTSSAGLLDPAAESPLGGAPFCDDVGEPLVLRRVPHDHDHVDVRGEKGFVRAKSLADQPLGAVTDDGAPDFS